MGVTTINVEARRECLASLCLKHNIRVKAFRESLYSDLSQWLSANDDNQIKKAVDCFASDVNQTINKHIENDLPKHYWRGKFDNRKYCDSYYITEQLSQVPAQQRRPLVIRYSELYQQTFTNTDNPAKKANEARRIANTWLREEVQKIITI